MNSRHTHHIALAIVLAVPLVACGGSLSFESDSDAGEDGTVDSVDDSTADSSDMPGDDGVDTPADTIEEPDPDGTDLTDEDGDTISDWHEGNGAVDTDGDGTPDSEDLDSDGDGIPDADEAGDDDLETPPEDCDDDGVGNFRERDSDDDGISDPDEATHGTDPCLPDTDGDGVSDLGEIAYGSDPTDPDDSPTESGDFVFIVPYEETPNPELDTLVFSTSLLMADVFFLMDTTGSMGGEIGNLQDDLSDTIVPSIRDVVPDSHFAVGRFDDYPLSPYGAPGTDVIFELLQRMTDDTDLVQDAVDLLSTHSGADGPEGHVPALWATATGLGLGTYLTDASLCTGGELGYPCFRPRSVPIIILITDAPFHNGPTDTPGVYADPYGSSVVPTPPNYDEAVAELLDINAKVVPIMSEGGWGDVEAQLTRLATDTGAVDGAGDPLLYHVDATGSGIGDQVAEAVETLATGVPIRVDAIAHDDPSDMVDAVDAFIDRINTNTSGSSIWDPILGEMRTCTSGILTGTPGTPPTIDYFEVVEPGVSVCFDIVPLENTTIPATTVPVVFRATIDVIGDEYTPLDSRDIFFVVPPEI